MLSWEKIDAIPGWFMFQSYCVWRALLDQQARVAGDLFEIGVWRGRSASLLAVSSTSSDLPQSRATFSAARSNAAPSPRRRARR